MGLEMEWGMHMPTVPSGPSGQGANGTTSNDGESLLDLMAEKDRIESELTTLSSVLDFVCPV